MYLLVLFAPLISFILSLLFGRIIGKNGVIILCIIGMLLSFLGSIYIYYEVCLIGSTCLITLYKWADLGLIIIEISFYFDIIVSIMLLMVSFISLLVHIYSIEYMSHDPSFNRFMAYLSLFTFFMFMLVSSDNFLQMFFGWEGVGLASYLLISFWYTRYLANKAAIKAMLMNKIGDLSLLIAISIIFLVFGSLKYSVVFNICYYYLNLNILILGFKFKLFYILCLFLFGGAVGKSAQLGLHTWLPDAMEGPTPVSALIHAATMVTAGVFLVIRCSYLFEQNENILIIVGIIGGLTCFFSAIIGSFQFDIKKIVAYSTCSH